MAASGAGIGFLTVMMVAGGVVLLVLGRHRMPELNLIKPIQSNSSCRSCLSSAKQQSGQKKKKKKKKQVQFAANVVEPRNNNDEYRRSWGHYK